MKFNLIFNNIFFNDEINFLFLKNKNIFLIKGTYGIILLYLPSYYYYNIINNDLFFIFFSKYKFFSFIKQIYFFYKFFYKIFFFRIKLKGLGFRIKQITKKIYRFFMGYNHYFYFYVPKNIFIWSKKRNLLAVSIDKIKLNDLFAQLLLIKKIDFYERTKTFIIPNKIYFIKK